MSISSNQKSTTGITSGALLIFGVGSESTTRNSHIGQSVMLLGESSILRGIAQMKMLKVENISSNVLRRPSVS